MKWRVMKNPWFTKNWVAVHPNGRIWYYGPTWIQAMEFVEEAINHSTGLETS